MVKGVHSDFNHWQICWNKTDEQFAVLQSPYSLLYVLQEKGVRSPSESLSFPYSRIETFHENLP